MYKAWKSACCRSLVFSDTWLGGSFFLECLLLIVVFVFGVWWGATAILKKKNKQQLKFVCVLLRIILNNKYKLNHLTQMNSFSYCRDIFHQFLCVMSFFRRILYMLSKLLNFVLMSLSYFIWIIIYLKRFYYKFFKIN